MNPQSQLDPQASVYFDRKTTFSASRDLATTRSKGFILHESQNQIDVWNMKAPDFTPKLYRSLREISRGKSGNIHPALVTVHSSESGVRPDKVAPKILPEIHQRKALPQFIGSFRPTDSLDSKLIFVKTGKYPTGPYKCPKPHDFRPLDEDMSNMVTASEKDPGQLNFKSQHLCMIQGTRSEPDFNLRGTFCKMDTYKPAEPRWEARLTLPKLPWPPKSASYTRHRRRRGVYSAFMDRVEEKISISWNG